MSDEDRPKPPVYLEGMRIARELGERQMALSRTVWAIETALRNVRIAAPGAEKARAATALAVVLDQHRRTKH